MHKSNYAESSLQAGSLLSHMRERWRAKRSRACASMLLCMTMLYMGSVSHFFARKELRR